jgi:hypothetical protein
MPVILGSAPADRHERDVLKELAAQLPPDWVVVANVCWTERRVGEGHSPTSYVRDGQADFVVVVPQFGLLVLEVKGSRFVEVRADGRWYRSSDGQHWESVGHKTPPEQGISNAHQIAALVANRMNWKGFPYPFGYLVVYPQGRVSQGCIQTFDSSTVVFRAQLHQLAQRIRAALAARGSLSGAQTLSADLAREVGLLLSNHPLKIEPADHVADVRADVEAIDLLTRQQHAALQGVFRHPRVAVSGPAGAGKTILAIWRLAALVEDGADAVYVCYNRMLAEYLRLRNPELSRYIHHVDSYFATVAQVRRNLDGVDRRKFFDEELPGLVLDAVSDWPDERKLDAVIVDEGQDFGEWRLWAVQSLLRREGVYVYFSDDRQDLYGRQARAAVGAEVVFSLVHNCRNTLRINQTSSRALGESVAPMPGLPEGVDTVLRSCVDRPAMARAAWALVGSWSGQATRTALLSPYRIEHSAMRESMKGHGKRLVTTLAEWHGQDTVLFATVKGFKGLEADAVVVVDVEVPTEDGPLSRSDLYVACTRARGRLALLATSESALATLRDKR